MMEHGVGSGEIRGGAKKCLAPPILNLAPLYFIPYYYNFSEVLSISKLSTVLAPHVLKV
jgi:hypothetical protein